MSYFRLFAIGFLFILTTTTSFGLVAEYRFETCNSTPTLANHVNKELNGTVDGDAQIAIGQGKIINGLKMSGDGMMTVKHDNSLDIVGDLTISFWINPNVIKQQALITRGLGSGTDRKYGSNAEYFIKMKDDGRLMYLHNFAENNLSAVAYSDQNLTANKWTHVILTRDTNRKVVRFYINGVPGKEYSYANAPKSSNSEKLILGYCEGCVNSGKFSGTLDEVKIYRILLSDGEIVSLFNDENDGNHYTGGCHPAPFAVDDTTDLDQSGAVLVDILANDRTNDSDTCKVDPSTVIIVNNIPNASLSDDNKTLTVPNEGNWSVNSNGSIQFISDSNFNGNPTDITYVVSDTCGNISNEATVSVTRVMSLPPSSGSNPPSSGGSSSPSGGGSFLDRNITIGDRVWYDTNRDGIQNPMERGVADVIVVLFDESENVIQRTTTDSSGIYHFYDVPAGTYTISFSNLPENYLFTLMDSGADDAKDSDVDSTGRTERFSVSNVIENLIYDAGIISSAGNIPSGDDGNSSTDDPSPSPRPSIDDGDTDGNPPTSGIDSVPSSDGGESCKCDDYESSIPTLNMVGFIVMLFLTSIFGTLYLSNKKSREIKLSLLLPFLLSSFGYSGGDLGRVTVTYDMVEDETPLEEEYIESVEEEPVYIEPEVEVEPESTTILPPPPPPKPIILSPQPAVKIKPKPKKNIFTNGLYAGLGITGVLCEYDCKCDDNTESKNEDTSYGATVRVGYDINQYVGVEARGSFMGLGSDNDTEIKHGGVYLKPMYPIGDVTNVYGLVGVAKTTVSSDKIASIDTEGLALGIGVEVDISGDTPKDGQYNRKFDGHGDQEKGLGIFVDYERMHVKSDSPDLDAFSAGITYDF